MITIQKEGYVFSVDVEKTIRYYQIHSLCKCKCCENFYAQVKEKFPKLKDFLYEFGVDISKPDEVMSLELEKTVQYIGVDYTVCGKVTTVGQCKIGIEDTQCLSLSITDGFVSPNEQSSRYFTISIENDI